MPQNDATPVIFFGRARDDPVLIAIGLGVCGSADDSGSSVGLFDKVLFLAIPEMELCFFVDESRVRVERRGRDVVRGGGGSLR